MSGSALRPRRSAVTPVQKDRLFLAVGAGVGLTSFSALLLNIPLRAVLIVAFLLLAPGGIVGSLLLKTSWPASPMPVLVFDAVIYSGLACLIFHRLKYQSRHGERCFILPEFRCLPIWRVYRPLARFGRVGCLNWESGSVSLTADFQRLQTSVLPGRFCARKVSTRMNTTKLRSRLCFREQTSGSSLNQGNT